MSRAAPRLGALALALLATACGPRLVHETITETDQLIVKLRRTVDDGVARASPVTATGRPRKMASAQLATIADLRRRTVLDGCSHIVPNLLSHVTSEINILLTSIITVSNMLSIIK